MYHKIAMLEKKKTNEEDKRKKEKTAILVILGILITLITAQLIIAKVPISVPFGSEVAVFILLNINLALLIVLIYLVIRNFFKVFLDYKRGLGSRIKYRLVFAFLILSIAPSFILFFISSAFISTSIERWFNINIERSLNESLKVAKTFYKNSSDNALFYARRISSIIKEKKLINQENLTHLDSFVREKKKEYNLESVEIFSAIKEQLVKEIPNVARPTDPSSAIIQDALNGKEVIFVEESRSGDIIRASVPIFSTFVATEPVGVVVVSYYIPHSMVSKMQIITETYEKYGKLLMFKKPLKSALIIMLLITTLLIIFTSIWFGLYMARQLTEPLDEMTDVALQVSKGNMNIRVDMDKKDEIGQLANAFNKMLTDIKNKNDIIEAQSNYLKILMNKVSTGILSITPDGRIATFNEMFKKIFELDNPSNRSIVEIFNNFYGGKEIVEIFALGKKGVQKEKVVQSSVNGKDKYIKIETAPMYDEYQNLIGIVGVFEDITESIRYQKMLAWREVARKVAHEVKNPLTPIQLSASRLKKKYENYIKDDEKETFNECINVIISQVDDIKNLIDEFSSYGRMPLLKKEIFNINSILLEVYSLFKDAHKNIEFKIDFDDNIPSINCDKTQLKRAFINLVTNAVEAIEDMQSGLITMTTKVDSDRNLIIISIKDNGKGIKKEYKERLFEPYFSRRKGGTGLGLYIVNNIITGHNGKIEVLDAVPKGTEFIISIPVKENV